MNSKFSRRSSSAASGSNSASWPPRPSAGFSVLKPWGDTRPYDVGIHHGPTSCACRSSPPPAAPAPATFASSSPTTSRNRTTLSPRLDLFAAYVIPVKRLVHHPRRPAPRHRTQTGNHAPPRRATQERPLQLRSLQRSLAPALQKPQSSSRASPGTRKERPLKGCALKGRGFSRAASSVSPRRAALQRRDHRYKLILSFRARRRRARNLLFHASERTMWSGHSCPLPLTLILHFHPCTRAKRSNAGALLEQRRLNSLL